MGQQKNVAKRFVGGEDAKHQDSLISIVEFPKIRNIVTDKWTLKTRKGRERLVDSVIPTNMLPTGQGAALYEVLDPTVGHYIGIGSSEGPGGGPSEIIIGNEPHTEKTEQGAITGGSLTHEQTLNYSGGGFGLSSSSVDTTKTASKVGWEGPAGVGTGHIGYRMGLSFNTASIDGTVQRVQLKLTRTASTDTLVSVTSYYQVFWYGAAYFGAAITTADVIEDDCVTVHDGKQTDYVLLASMTSTALVALGTGDDAIVFDLDVNKVLRNLIVNRDGNTDLLLTMTTSTAPGALTSLSAISPDSHVLENRTVSLATDDHATATKRPHLVVTTIP